MTITVSACKEGHKKDCDMLSNVGIPSAQKDESYCTCGKSNPPTETVSDEKKVVCSKCGKDEFIGNWNKTTQEELKSRKFCFECNYWYELFLRKDGKDVIRLDGIHRSLGEDKPTTPDRFKGSCGSKFVVEFMDGRVVTTTDLWYQGKIPDAWKAELPDNAISLKGTK